MIMLFRIFHYEIYIYKWEEPTFTSIFTQITTDLKSDLVKTQFQFPIALIINPEFGVSYTWINYPIGYTTIIIGLQ